MQHSITGDPVSGTGFWMARIRTAAIVTLLVGLGTPGRAEAQAPRGRDSLAAAAAAIQDTRSFLFKGIALTAAESTKATKIIAAARAKARQTQRPGSVAPVEIYAERNGELRALLTTPADRRAFDANLARQQYTVQGQRRGAVMFHP